MTTNVRSLRNKYIIERRQNYNENSIAKKQVQKDVKITTENQSLRNRLPKTSKWQRKFDREETS